MDDPEVVMVGHTGHVLRVLNIIGEQGRKSRGNGKWVYQSQPVCLWIGSCIPHHIPVGHSLIEDAETM